MIYNSAADIIEGFVDDGYDREMEIADHVIVWIIKGIYDNQPWKQPIAFSFCKGSTPCTTLIRTYKDIVTELQNVGLIVVASICDQGSSNTKAICCTRWGGRTK